MAFAYTTTGATDQSSIVRGKVGFVPGVYSAGGLSTGTIVTGGGTVMAHGVNTSMTASGATSIVASQPNLTGASATAVGSIGVLQIDDASNGDWWAIVQLP